MSRPVRPARVSDVLRALSDSFVSVAHQQFGVAEAEQCLLPCGRFVQVHRSYIVSTEKVERFSRWEIRLIGGDSPVSMGR